jgi:hypothetical protein
MKQHRLSLSLATAVFLAAAGTAFAQTAATPAPAMTPGQIALKHHELPKTFSTEAAAQAACKTPVIWAATKARLYYPQAAAGFGTIRPGVYACVKDAIKAGYRKAPA